MEALTGPVVAGALLLVVAGVPKLVDPTGTVRALRSVGWRRAGPWAVRGGALVEVAVGTGAVLAGGRWWAAAVAALYAGFAGFLALALRRPASSCGCAGSRETPPTMAHLVMTVVLAGAAASAVATGSEGAIGLLADHGRGDALALLGLAGLTAWLGWVVLTVLPTVQTRARSQKSLRSAVTG